NATGISAYITTEQEGVSFSQRNLAYNNIATGSYAFSTDHAVMRTNMSVNTLSIPCKLHLSSNQEATNLYPYSIEIPFTVNLSANMPNWPLVLNGQTVSAPKVADLDGTGNRFITTYNGQLHVVNTQKQYNEGFPMAIGDNTLCGIAIGHLTGPTNQQQIVVGTSSGTVKVINHLGQVVAEKELGSSVRTAPVIADLNNDGQNEIIVTTLNSRIWVLNLQGNNLPEWANYPIVLTGQISTHLAVGDVTGDNIKNIVVNTSGPQAALNVLNPMTRENLPGFPVAGTSNVGPTLARISGTTGLQIVVPGLSATNCPIIIYNSDGSVLRQTTIPSKINSDIAIVDLFNDGNQKFVFIDNSSKLYVKNTDFSDVAGFPKNIGATLESPPVFANLTNENQKHIIFGDSNGRLHIVRPNGQYIPGYPLKISNYAIKTSPWVGRFHNYNGVVILVDPEAVYAIDTKRFIQNRFWNSFRANNGNTASYNDPTTPDIEIIDPVYVNNLSQNYPNPFNPTTNIEFTISKNENVKLSIFNIKGQLVKTIVNEPFKAGQHNVTWNGLDSNNQTVSSGLYFYKIDTESFTAIKRMIMLK
ncbi:MAG: T9SS type A sorting domain-containing protein, partial [Candidatus Cloacimonetes bacterium]|nr:T9SS type A sorting domain-containing protein [Candidatus Cloacimonadota bacterium]